MSERAQCVLCGREDHDVRERLVEWTEAVMAASGHPRWDSAFRCPDYQACRRRVEAKPGGGRPVRDSVTRPTIKQPVEREEVRV